MLLETMGHLTINNEKTAVKLHIEQMMRNRNFRAQNDVVERASVTKSEKSKKACVEWKWKSVFSGKHMDKVQEETLVASVMTGVSSQMCVAPFAAWRSWSRP